MKREVEKLYMGRCSGRCRRGPEGWGRVVAEGALLEEGGRVRGAVRTLPTEIVD